LTVDYLSVSVKTNGGYCARNMRVLSFLIYSVGYSANSCHNCIETMIGFYYH